MKLIKAVWYTSKRFPNWFKYEFVKNYKMTDEERRERALQDAKDLAEWQEEQRWMGSWCDEGNDIAVEVDDDKPPF